LTKTKRTRKRPQTVAGKFKPCSWQDFLILFSYGLIWDGLLTVDVIVTATYRVAWAMTTTAIITLISFTAYDKVIGRAGVDWKRLAILATGSAVGAGVTTYLLS
jgi:hypothetical protein